MLIMAKLLSTEKLLPHLFTYVVRTGHFKETMGDIDTVQ
jgi:hypothetical protein